MAQKEVVGGQEEHDVEEHKCNIINNMWSVGKKMGIVNIKKPSHKGSSAF